MSLNDPTITNAETWDAEARQAWLAGDFPRSRQLFEQVLEARRALDSKEGIVYALFHVTQTMRYAPGYDPSLARPFLEEALLVAQQIGTERYIQPAELNLAWLAYDLGDYAVVFSKLQQLITWFFQVGDPGGTCLGLEILAKSLIGLGVMEPALRLYAAATAIREQHGMQHTVPAVIASEERILSPVRSQLGETRCAAVEAEGRAFDLEQAVAYARSITFATT